MFSKISILLLFTIVSLSLTGSAFAHTSDVAGDYKLEIGWHDEPPVVGMGNTITLEVTHATDFDKQSAEKMHASMNMKNMDDKMNMKNYDEKIIAVLDNFDSNELNSQTAISQISKIINEQNPDDDTGIEIKNLIDDVDSGIITDEDALYSLIGMLGTVSPHKMDSSTMNEDHTMSHEGHDTDNGEGINNLSNELNVEVMLKDKITSLNLVETKFSGVYEAKFMPAVAGFPMVHVTGNIFQTPVDITFHPEEIESLSTLSPLKQVENGINPSDVQCKNNLELFMRIQTESAVCVSPENGQKLLELGVVDYF